jgi:uncharacterized membrane protein YecN with MAPEG domain
MANTGIYIVLAGVQALVLIILGMNVSWCRNKYKVAGDYDTADPKYANLYRAQRAHGNQAEWGPMFMLLFLLIVAGEGSESQAGILAIAIWATLARVANAYALGFTNSLAKASALRRITAVSTYLTSLILAVYAIYLGAKLQAR